MLPQEWLLALLIAGTATALASIPRRPMEESLKSALDAISRKQRSLDSQEYYNDLRSFKYHGGEGERKFNVRERPGDNNRELEEEDEEIEFLPSGKTGFHISHFPAYRAKQIQLIENLIVDAGQLETVGNGFQDLNDKLLERALIDYLENIPQQEEPVTSSFRERERGSSHKRGADRSNMDNKELLKLFLEELQDGTPYNLEDIGEEGYTDARRMLYDRYRGDQGNKLYENSGGPMSWGELMNKESLFRGQDRESDENEFADQDPNLLYPFPAERRNVNGRYPIGRDLETYRSMAKRYPVAKRSPKPMTVNKQVTDPKVAQDLGALFGTQSTNNQNHTHNHDHDHDHDHNHDHDHEHEHEHEHDHEHDDQRKHESSSESPKVSPPPKGQKENVTKPNKSKSIEVRKKSVDWSQYFGIDRRRKKANFVGGQGTQSQDDEWMLQRYYENMAGNLKSNDHRDYQKETNNGKDKLEETNLKQQNIKDLIVEDALRYVNLEDEADLRKVKDKIMARIAAVYSLEKMRKALDELRNNVAVRIEAQKIARSRNNQTSNFRENNNAAKASEKRTSNSIVENETFQENRICPELEVIEKRCRTAATLAGDHLQMLYLPCVMLQICKACVQHDVEEECLGYYDMEAIKICNDEGMQDQKERVVCVRTAVILSNLQPPAAISMQCHVNGNESCLRRYHHRYLHRYLRYPYDDQRSNNGYENESIGTRQMDR